MKEKEIKEYWNNNARTWTELSRRGYDLYRDYIATPAFLALLPPVKRLVGLDVGCGEGHNTQLLTDKEAIMTGIDISETFINFAKEREAGNRNLKFLTASACNLPFKDEYFDFCVSTMVFMDFPDQEKALQEIYRVLKVKGFFQFSIIHPFYDRIASEWIYENGKLKGYLVKDYFINPEGEIDEWMFSALPASDRTKYDKFKIPRFNKLISEWINILVQMGFTIERMAEPFPDKNIVKKFPKLRDATIMPYFLIIRVRK
jgi:ubiquinone/menaquinone biosynthesis C-methylase UbiE